MKLKGSIKTGVTCPSMIKVIQQSHDEATQVQVIYQSTHVGHKCEVGRLPLQKEDRNSIAGMLHEGISASNVLDKMTNYSNTNAKQLTRQDVYNVA